MKSWLCSHVTALASSTDKQLAEIDQNLDQHMREHFHDLSKLLGSTKGIGPVTTTTLAAALPELGRLDRRAIASLVGVAPLACDSGKRRGGRHVGGGRADVRRSCTWPY